MDPRAIPLANEKQASRVYEMVTQVRGIRGSARGVNEVTKAINKGRARLVLIAADALPLELVLHLPDVCEDKGVAYIFVPSRQELGKAAGLSRSCIAIAIKNPRSGSILEDKLNAFLLELGH